MLDPWVRDYQTHKWVKYEVSPGSPEAPPMEPDTTFDVCHSDSEWARHIKFKTNRFYWNEELVAADLEPVWGGKLGRLTKAWRGHFAGKLVMVVYAGCDKSPPTFTYAVEVG